MPPVFVAETPLGSIGILFAELVAVVAVEAVVAVVAAAGVVLAALEVEVVTAATALFMIGTRMIFLLGDVAADVVMMVVMLPLLVAVAALDVAAAAEVMMALASGFFGIDE